MSLENQFSTTNEANLILTAGAIQFVNILDFMMVMPLGPDFARSLGIPINDIGLIGGVYAFAAGISGLIASFFLDKFPRKQAILFFLAGLSIATLGGAVAWSRDSMIAARIIAGVFGGPMTGLSIALLSDFIPPERRGRAMGKVMGAFSVATVVGLPFGLELASRTSWHAPFIVTSILGFCILAYGAKALPYRPAFGRDTVWRDRMRAMGRLLQSRVVILSYLLVFLSMWAAFIIIPNISAHLQLDWGYPRAKLGLLYFIGGIVTFFTMRGAGILIDRTSTTLVSILATVLFVIVMLAGFIYAPNPLPPLLIFVAFMLAMTTRNICGQSLFSKIPPPELRGAYNSLQTALMSLTQALAAYFSSLILIERNDKLLHIATLGWVAIACSLGVPVLFYYIETHLKRVS